MNEKQVVHSEIAKLIKQIQFERNHPNLTQQQLLKLQEVLKEALTVVQIPKE